VVDIQGAEGGQEAALFAADLFKMYSRWAEARGWKVDVIEARETGIGGFDKIEFEVHGDGAYSRLKYEAGVHRVQRVPETESQGRIHTSAATVAVMPEADAVEVELPDKDLSIETSTATGPAGQATSVPASSYADQHPVPSAMATPDAATPNVAQTPTAKITKPNANTHPVVQPAVITLLQLLLAAFDLSTQQGRALTGLILLAIGIIGFFVITRWQRS